METTNPNPTAAAPPALVRAKADRRTILEAFDDLRTCPIGRDATSLDILAHMPDLTDEEAMVVGGMLEDLRDGVPRSSVIAQWVCGGAA